MISVTVWNSVESIIALRDRSPPGSPVGVKPVLVEVFGGVEEF